MQDAFFEGRGPRRPRVKFPLRYRARAIFAPVTNAGMDHGYTGHGSPLEIFSPPRRDSVLLARCTLLREAVIEYSKRKPQCWAVLGDFVKTLASANKRSLAPDGCGLSFRTMQTGRAFQGVCEKRIGGWFRVGNV